MSSIQFKNSLFAGWLLMVGSIVATACAQDFQPQQVTSTHELHNVWQLSSRIFSGSEPSGEVAFAELKKLGIHTIVSVDGLVPNVELAKQYGIRTIHIPIGYDGIPEDARLALVRVARDVQGKIYVHCQHGKHRGPAGAAILCRADDGRGVPAALQILKSAGTGPEYAGLWRSVEQFTVPKDSTPLPKLMERHDAPTLALEMAKLDRTNKRVKELSAKGWIDSGKADELKPHQAATLLMEHFAESQRLLTNNPDADLVKQMQSATDLANELVDVLRKSPVDKEAAERVMARLQTSCVACHQQFRN